MPSLVLIDVLLFVVTATEVRAWHFGFGSRVTGLVVSGSRTSQIIVVYKLPVHQCPERVQVFGPRVAVVDIIGMFPHVHRQQGRDGRIRQRCIGVTGIDDGQAAVAVFNQPGPARTEVAYCSTGKFLSELVERAERVIDGCGDGASGRTAALRTQAVPVKAVVPHLGGVVEKATRGRPDNIFQ